VDLKELKKQCRAAVKILVRDHGYTLDQFTPADGDEAIYAPSNLDAKYQRHGFIEPGVHKGTPLYWYRSSYEYDEWDCTLPSVILAEIEFWAKLTPEQLSEMMNPR